MSNNFLSALVGHNPLEYGKAVHQRDRANKLAELMNRQRMAQQQQLMQQRKQQMGHNKQFASQRAAQEARAQELHGRQMAPPTYTPSASEIELLSYLDPTEYQGIEGMTQGQRTQLLVKAAKSKRSGAPRKSPLTGVKGGQGYNPETGMMEKVPMSPELQAAEDAKRQKFVDLQMASYQNIVGTIDEAIGIVDEGEGDWFDTTGGTLGKMSDSMPFMEQGYTLNRAIDTIQANLSFDKLQAIRDASKTGGGLGAVSERELALLGSAVASLDPGLPPAKKRANLNKVKDHYQRFMAGLRDSSAVQPSAHSEADITATMEATGLSREEVLAELRKRDGG